MSALSYFTIEEFRNVAGLRNIVGYENMSWQELENICATPSATIPTTIEVPRPRIRPRTRPKPRPIRLLETSKWWGWA